MKFMKISNHRFTDYFIYDGHEFVGRTETQEQALWYIKNASNLKDLDSFMNEIQNVIDFTASVDEEIGYEFKTEKEVTALYRSRWPEILGVKLWIKTRGAGGVWLKRKKRVDKILFSGAGWSGYVINDYADHWSFFNETLEEINEFKNSCANYGFEVEDYRRTVKFVFKEDDEHIGMYGFPYERNGCVSYVELSGFTGNKVVLDDCFNMWLVSLDRVKKALAE